LTLKKLLRRYVLSLIVELNQQKFIMKKIFILIQLLAIMVMANSQTCSPSVVIAASPLSPVCTGTSVTFTATPTDAGSTPTYQWKINGNNDGTNSASYTPATLANGDAISVDMTSSTPCSPTATVSSNTVTMTLNPLLTPSVVIASGSGTTICDGSSVTFTATPTNGGSTPVYQWKLNGGNVGTNSVNYTNASLTNGDIVSLTMTSNAVCPSSATVNCTSNITMTVLPNLTPSVTISGPTGQICSAGSVTFTATPTNEGTPVPSYQWRLNGNNISGATAVTYTNNDWHNNDVISVVMTSNYQCTTAATATDAAPALDVAISPSNIITPFGPTRFCNGGFVTLSAASTGNAIGFNGGRVSAASGAFDVDVNDFTVEAWIYPRANSTGAIVAQGGFTSQQGFLFEFNANGAGSLSLKTVNGSNVSNVVQTSGGLSLNQWQHVAASVKRSNSGNLTALYVNGNQVATGNIPADDLTNAGIEIGGSSNSGFNFNGVIDEVRIWNVARNQLDIGGTMGAIIAPTSTNLQSYYRFDDTSGTTVANSVSGGA
jgi:hypothetical protein